ncbi:MAG: hypothetical protein RMK89_00425 [Armatimonadota bacterium]|nr:hypothetical protein [Armatimonadota bacterium]MDW8141902.1 hypothetical protein [Armatimonadota bacterium]
MRVILNLVMFGLVCWKAIGWAEPLKQPQGVAFSPDGTKLAVSDTGNNRILLFSSRFGGWRLLTIANGLDNPQKLVWLDGSRVFMCEGGMRQVTILRLRGNKLERERTVTGFKRPTGLTVWRDWVFVADAETRRLVVLTVDGKEVASFGDGLNVPSDVAVADDGTVFVADDSGEIKVLRFDTERKQVQPEEPKTLSGFWTCKSVSVVGSELWALSSYSGELKRTNVKELSSPRWRIFSGFLEGAERDVIAVHSGHRTPDGKPSRNSIFANGQVPQVLALGRLGEPLSPTWDFDVALKANLLTVATGNRVLILPADFKLPTRPKINATQTEATVAWETPIPTETLLEFRSANEQNWQRVKLAGKRTYHRVLLRNLKPATAYRLRIQLPNCHEITDAHSQVPNAFSFEFAFATEPPKGKAMFLRVPVAVLVYADVVNVDSLTPNAPPAPPVDRTYIDYLRHEVEKAQLFYWCNSHMKLWLDCDWFIITKRITTGKGEPPQKDWRQDLEALLKLRGRSLSEYPAVVEITCERVWNAKERRYEFAPSGGGTYGADMRPGSSHFLGGHDPAWLFVHEFHHQLDSQFAESGYLEYPFNHFAITPYGFADNFGEHYNGNAWILRNWHDGNLNLWFVNKFGHVVIADDVDEDGIPDDCPAVPLDEKRFGSSPLLKDTDSDGLTDLDEVLAFTWVWEMLVWPNETNARAKYVLPNPNNPDSDGDGLIDGNDPLPIYACKPVIKRDEGRGTRDEVWFVVEEDLTDVPTPIKVERPTHPFKGEIFLSHDGERLLFRFVFNEPVALVHLQLDCLANGYYVGADNLDIRLRPDWNSLKVSLDVSVNNAGSRERWPFADRSLVSAENVQTSLRRDEGARGYELVVSVLRAETIGLTLNSGEQIGLAIYLQIEPVSPRWLSVFEPYRLVRLRVE